MLGLGGISRDRRTVRSKRLPGSMSWSDEDVFDGDIRWRVDERALGLLLAGVSFDPVVVGRLDPDIAARLGASKIVRKQCRQLGPSEQEKMKFVVGQLEKAGKHLRQQVLFTQTSKEDSFVRK